MAEYFIESEEKNNNWRRIIFLSIVYFFYIYGLPLPGLPHGFLYYRIALAIMLIYTCVSSDLKATNFGKSRSSRMVRRYLWWNVFLFFHVGFILLAVGRGTGLSALPSYINMLIVLPLFYISGKYIFRNIEELMKVLYIGCIIQAVIIILATLIPSLGVSLKYIFLGSANDMEELINIDRMLEGGYHIGFQCFTSQGGLKIAIGEIGACYFLMKNGGRKFYLHFIIFLFITFATTLIARTGLFISIICLFIVLITKAKQGFKGLASSLLIFLIVYLIFYNVIGGLSTSDYLNTNLNRFNSLVSNGMKESYFNEWMGAGEGGNIVPPLSGYTLWGLGIRQGVSGAGIETVVDGGFLINYSSMGLIVAIINYLIIISFFVKQYRSSNNRIFKSLLIIILSILIMGEIKEHFIYQLHFMCFMFVIFYLIEKEEYRSCKVS